MECDEVKNEVESCQACGCVVDVAVQSPYARIACPECGEEWHVKCAVGNYVIQSKHGVGGMSVVFAAEDATLGRAVALKLLNEDHSRDPKRIEEFEKEAKITASISHPNVVRVFTVGQAYSRYYIAMELIKGESLEQLMRREGVIEEQLLVRLAIETVEGLQAAHQAGLIHRDLKPGNILIDQKGRAKIVDFGLALMTQGGKAMAEEIWATPYYVPPETLRMEEEDLRSDIYALGASLYHAIVGEELFAIDTRSTSELIKVKTTLAQLAGRESQSSTHFAHVVDKMMAFDPAHRYQCYSSLLENLRMVEVFHRSGVEPDFSKKASPKRQSKVLGVSLVAMALAAGAWWVVGSSEKADEKAVEPVTQLESVSDQDAEARAQKKRMGQELGEAMEKFERGAYAGAYQKYVGLLENPSLDSETAHWVAIQAAVSALLQGELEQVHAALEVVKQRHGGGEKEVSALVAVVDFLQSEGELSFDPTDKTAQEVLAVALVQWEKQEFESAQDLFLKLESYSAEEKAYWMAAQKHLSDYQLLMPWLDLEVKENLQWLTNQTAAVQKLEQQLQTRGAAQHFLQCVQEHLLDTKEELLKKREEQRVLAEQERKRKEELLQKHKQQLMSVYEEHDYAAILDMLELPVFDETRDWRARHLLVAKSLLALRAITFQELEGKSGALILHSRGEKGSFTRLLGAEEAGVQVSNQSGQMVLLAWSELAPNSMLEIHSRLKVAHLTAAEQRERKALLVVYAWRNGHADQAQEWADELMAQDPAFADTWELLSSE